LRIEKQTFEVFIVVFSCSLHVIVSSWAERSLRVLRAMCAAIENSLPQSSSFETPFACHEPTTRKKGKIKEK
jgi:hypothetical protein